MQPTILSLRFQLEAINKNCPFVINSALSHISGFRMVKRTACAFVHTKQALHQDETAEPLNVLKHVKSVIGQMMAVAVEQRKHSWADERC